MTFRKKIGTILISVFLFSCGGIHVPFSYAKSDSVIEPGGNFVKLISGEIIKTKKLQYKKQDFILDTKTVDAADVQAYQSGERYAVKSPGRSYFINRIVKGKINVYSTTSMGSGDIGRGGSENTTSASYYVQKGNSGEVMHMTPEVLREMTKDNEDAYAVVKNMKNIVTNIPKLEKAVKIYNEN